MKKVLTISLLVIVIGFLIFGYIWFYVPYSNSGVKSGILNYVKHEGVIFKTYEGLLIQSGFGTVRSGGLQSNEFRFSIENKELAIKLMSKSGHNVQLHYKEYYGALPWRGDTKFIVDSIVSSESIMPVPSQEIPPYTGQ